MKRTQKQRKKSKPTSWLTYFVLTGGVMLVSFLAARHWGAHFEWETISDSVASKTDILRRVPEDGLVLPAPPIDLQPLVQDHIPQPTKEIIFKPAPSSSSSSSSSSSTTTTLTNLVSHSLLKQDNLLTSSIRLREGHVWTSGVRPGCVYWWCYSHPQSPAPGGYQAKRSVKHQSLVDGKWLTKMTKRYPDHALKFHKNRTIYYSEPKDHFDLTNIAFSSGSVHIYNPDEQTRKLIINKLSTDAIEKNKLFHHQQQQMKQKRKTPNEHQPNKGKASSYQLPCYESIDIKNKESGSHFLCPKLIIHETPLDVKKQCQSSSIVDERKGGMINRTVFFLAPHFPGNFFHIMNDNLIPLLTDLQATPGCDSESLSCELPAALAQFWFNPDRVAGGANKWWDMLFPSLFQNVWSAETLLGGEQLTCLKRVSWGLGPRPFYTDFIEARVNTLRALRAHTLRLHHISQDLINAEVVADLTPTKKPKVVFIRRYKKTKEQNPRGSGVSYNRVLGDPDQLESGFASLGIPMVTCCDFSASLKDMLEVVADADVVVSLHGAGLINGIFAKTGSILIELHGGYGADDVIFRRLSQGRSGGYMKVQVNENKEGHFIGKERAEAVARCAVSLLKGSNCLPHTDIEESWRASDMRPRV